jgi:hypothetical protein
VVSAIITSMALSFEEFRTSLLNAEGRQALGIHLTDAEAHQVYADPQATQSWFDYWQSTNQPPAPTAAPTAPPAAETVALGGHDLPQAADHTATAAYGTAPADYGQAPAGYGQAPTGHGQAPAGYDPAVGFVGAPSSDAPSKKKRTGLWITLSILGALILIIGIVVILAFTTARHWTKTDVAEKPETFYTETYETGLYNVADDGVSVCAIDQDWTECADAMEAQYAGACAGVELTVPATVLCAQHRTEIDRMRSLDQEGYIVAALGSFGHLTRTAETSTREVSNEDYEPAVTHEAVCYFEFLGECE